MIVDTGGRVDPNTGLVYSDGRAVLNTACPHCEDVPGSGRRVVICGICGRGALPADRAQLRLTVEPLCDRCLYNPATTTTWFRLHSTNRFASTKRCDDHPFRLRGRS